MDAYEPYAGPVDYTIQTMQAEPADRPVVETQPTVVIDGIVIDDVEIGHTTVVYPNAEAAYASSHLIQLRAGDQVVRSFPWQIEPDSCEHPVGLRTFRVELCAFASGDIRLFSTYAGGDHENCVGDAFCMTCQVLQCAAGQRCTSRATLLDPFFSHLACAPIGPRALGEACTWNADPDGAYDDCGEDLACIAGTCQRTCLGPTCPASCTYAAGHAPELKICP